MPTQTLKTADEWVAAIKTACAQTGAPTAYAWSLAMRLKARHPNAQVRIEDGMIEVWHEGSLDDLTTGWERVA